MFWEACQSNHCSVLSEYQQYSKMESILITDWVVPFSPKWWQKYEDTHNHLMPLLSILGITRYEFQWVFLCVIRNIAYGLYRWWVHSRACRISSWNLWSWRIIWSSQCLWSVFWARSLNRWRWVHTSPQKPERHQEVQASRWCPASTGGRIRVCWC